MRRSLYIPSPQNIENIYAARTNGSTQLEIVTAPDDIKTLESWTLTQWVYGAFVNTGYQTVFYVGNSTTTQGTFLLLDTNNNYTSWRFNWWEDNIQRISSQVVSPSAPWRPVDMNGGWHCFVLNYTYATQQIRFEIDGQGIYTPAAGDYRLSRLFSATYPADVVCMSGYRFNNTYGGYCPGRHDELALWDGAKVYADVSDSGVPANLKGKAGLKHWWSYDKASDTGDSCADRVSGGPALAGVNSPVRKWAWDLKKLTTDGTSQWVDAAPCAAFQSAQSWSITWWEDAGNYAGITNGRYFWLGNTTGAAATYLYAGIYNGNNWEWGAVVDGVPAFFNRVDYGVTAYRPFGMPSYNPVQVTVSYDHPTTTLTWSHVGQGGAWVQTIFTRSDVALPMTTLFGATTPPDKICFHGYTSNGTPAGYMPGSVNEAALWSEVKTYADLHYNNLPITLVGKSGLCDWWGWDQSTDTADLAGNNVAGGDSMVGHGTPTLTAALA